MSTKSIESAIPVAGTPPATPPPVVTPPADDALDPAMQALFGVVANAAPNAPPADPNKIKKEEGGGRSLDDAIRGDVTPPPVDPNAPKDPKDVTPPPAPPPAEPPAKPIRVRKNTAPVPPVITPPVETPPAPPPAKSKDQELEEGLLEEERDQLELARYAEGKDPTKYKGLGAKTLKFLTEHAKYIEEARKKDAEVALDESNEAYQKWLKDNKPNLSQREVVQLERMRIKDEVQAGSRSEIDEMKEEIFRTNESPKIKAASDNIFGQVTLESAPEDLQKVIKEQGSTKARELFPLEFKEITEVAAGVASDVETFLRLTTKNPTTGKPVEAFNDKNEQHIRMLSFMNAQCDHFKANGGASLLKDGKQFVTRAEFFGMKPEQRGPYWTFSNEQIVAMARYVATNRAKERIEERRAELDKMGYTRKPAANPTPPPTNQPPPNSPPAAPLPAPIPGGNVTPPAGDAPERALATLYGSPSS